MFSSQRRLHRRLASLSVVALGAAAIAAACSSSAATPSSAVAGATAEASVPASTAATTAGTLVLASTNSPSLGEFLTGRDGMTLYVFTNDAADVSNCSGTCATNWPPLTVAAGTVVQGPADATGVFGTIARSDGTMQVTYEHMPLYYYGGDAKAGDTTGQGVGGLWYVALVSPATSSSPTAPGSPAASGSPASQGYSQY